MYTYYFFAAMRWPFPRAVKRNLTTMQIAQIASGTFLTNLYLITALNPDKVVAGFKANNVSSWFQQNPAKDESIFVHALLRAASSDPHTCMQTTGAEIALHVNTMYMFVSIALESSDRLPLARGTQGTDTLTFASFVITAAACPLLQLLHALLHSEAQIRPQLPASQEQIDSSRSSRLPVMVKDCTSYTHCRQSS